jgi:hypothetical protein
MSPTAHPWQHTFYAGADVKACRYLVVFAFEGVADDEDCPSWPEVLPAARDSPRRQSKSPPALTTSFIAFFPATYISQWRACFTMLRMGKQLPVHLIDSY